MKDLIFDWLVKRSTKPQDLNEIEEEQDAHFSEIPIDDSEDTMLVTL